jgi:hypothetical protein
VSPERIGSVGRDAYPDHYYAAERARVLIGSATPQADIPIVVEAWAKKTGEKGNITLAVLVNRMPITGEISSHRQSDKHICVFGCGLAHSLKETPTKGVMLNPTRSQSARPAICLL